ncbi:MAG: shikimate kinase, partial [Flavobacteriaceae bacterium]|nr:shikimate kinase [Flavobacteriaceae bacterium]
MRAFKLVLLGYMGSGKTTIGKYLKQDLNYKLYDLDNYIEEKWDLNAKK